MTLKLMVAVGLLGLVAVPAVAQDQPSLADVARQQKSKEKNKPAKVFTNDNLPVGGDAVSTGTGRAPGVEPAAPAAKADDASKAAAQKPGAKGKVDEERVKAAQAEVAKWQKELQDLAKVQDTLQSKIASAPNDNVRQQYQEMVGHVPGKVSEAQQNLSNAQKELQSAMSGDGGQAQAPPPPPAGQAPPADNSNPQ